MPFVKILSQQKQYKTKIEQILDDFYSWGISLHTEKSSVKILYIKNSYKQILEIS